MRPASKDARPPIPIYPYLNTPKQPAYARPENVTIRQLPRRTPSELKTSESTTAYAFRRAKIAHYNTRQQPIGLKGAPILRGEKHQVCQRRQM